MNSWSTKNSDIPARVKATWKFCEYLDDPKHDDERQLCKCDSDEAKKLFAKLGEFYLEKDLPPDASPDMKPIPTTTEFRVYDDDPHKDRDSLVTIVLPNCGHLPTGNEFEARNYYRCTYEPYVSVLQP